MQISRARLSVEMAKLDLNFKQLASVSGVSRATLSYINNGKNCRPDIVHKIAKALNVEVTELLEEN